MMKIVTTRSTTTLAAAALLVAAVLSCASPPPRREVKPGDLERGAAALAPVKKRLMGALTKAMSEEGPEAAIQVCQVKASKLSESEDPGIEIGRTSHRLRNPKNAPEPWMQPLLDAYLASDRPGEPRAVVLDDGRIGYVEPIRVSSFCLTCHGEKVDDSVKGKLAALYPRDEATGFRSGDFRGLFWAKLPPE